MQRVSRFLHIVLQTSPPKSNCHANTRKLLDITIEEVEEANTAQKPWVVIRNNVYDLTTFINKHPGGRDFILAAIGRDATAVYESTHSENNTKVLTKYLIGTLTGATNVPQYPKHSTFFEELRERISTYFKEQGKNPRDAPLMLLSYLAITAVFIAMYLPMFFQPKSWTISWVPFLSAAVSGWSCAMMGLYFCHDACHASISNSPFIWNSLRRIYETFTGLNTLLWIYQHGLGHHPYTNVIGADPDIDGPAMDVIRLHHEKPWWNLYRWQKYYWLPLYSQMVLSRKLYEHISVFYDRKWKFIKINPPELMEYIWTFMTLSIYILHHYYIPHFYLRVPLIRLFVLHTITDLTWSLYLGIIFQASHINNEVAWPLPSSSLSVDWKKSDWAALQIESSLDFAHGDFWTTWLCGSLNYQAVHHLFPHVNQYYYPEIAPIVIQCCKEYGIKYHLKEDIWDMIKAHVGKLEALGEEVIILR